MSALRCPRCLLPQAACLCAEIPTVITRTRVVIVRHHSEHNRSSNTGRLAHLALPNSEIVDHLMPLAPRDDGTPQCGEAQLPPLDGAWLLYPGGAPRTQAPVPPPRQLVVLDGTWAQAGKMYRRLAALRGLPILRLPDGDVPAARLRESPGPGRVSTIEAIARALRLLEGEAVGAPLERLFEIAVARAYSFGRQLKT